LKCFCHTNRFSLASSRTGKSKQSATRSKINTPKKIYKIIGIAINNKNNYPYNFESNKNECFDLNLYQ